MNTPVGQRVGDAVYIEMRSLNAVVFGRVTGYDGDSYHGVRPILLITTPHGSTYFSGLAWVHPIEADSQQAAELEKYERLAITRFEQDIEQRPYAGKLVPSGTGWMATQSVASGI